MIRDKAVADFFDETGKKTLGELGMTPEIVVDDPTDEAQVKMASMIRRIIGGMTVAEYRERMTPVVKEAVDHLWRHGHATLKFTGQGAVLDGVALSRVNGGEGRSRTDESHHPRLKGQS